MGLPSLSSTKSTAGNFRSTGIPVAHIKFLLARTADDLFASGDKDPTGNQNGRFDPLFGTYGFSFTPTGIWGLFKRSNINSPGYVISVRPAKDFQASFKQ